MSIKTQMLTLFDKYRKKHGLNDAYPLDRMMMEYPAHADYFRLFQLAWNLAENVEAAHQDLWRDMTECTIGANKRSEAKK